MVVNSGNADNSGKHLPTAHKSRKARQAKQPQHLPEADFIQERPLPILTSIPLQVMKTPASAIRRQQQEAQRIATDVAVAVAAMNLKDLFGDRLTRAQRYIIRDALRTVYLPVLAHR